MDSKSTGFMSRMDLTGTVAEMSANAYNLLIGALLAYGFGVNYVICRFGMTSVLNLIGKMTMSTFFIVYFVCVIAGAVLSHRKNPVLSFIGYNLIVLPLGVLLTLLTAQYDPYIVTKAASATAIVSVVMMMVSAIKPDLFLGMGRSLCIALFAAVIAQLVQTLIFKTTSTIIDYAIVAIMALYIGFDWARANSIPRTACNAINVAVSLYLDIVNIFIRLLRIFGKRSN